MAPERFLHISNDISSSLGLSLFTTVLWIRQFLFVCLAATPNPNNKLQVFFVALQVGYLIVLQVVNGTQVLGPSVLLCSSQS